MRELWYWCEIGDSYRQIVTVQDCRLCDRDVSMPDGACKYCSFRKPYVTKIQQFFDDVVWYLKLLWRKPVTFTCFFAQHILAPSILCSVTTVWNSGNRFPHLEYGRLKQKTHAGV